MPGDSEQPVTLGDLKVYGPPTSDFNGLLGQNVTSRDVRPATVADLKSACRALDWLVIEKDPDGEWPEWAINPVNEMSQRISKFVLDALAEAQPFPPAGGVS